MTAFKRFDVIYSDTARTHYIVLEVQDGNYKLQIKESQKFWAVTQRKQHELDDNDFKLYNPSI